MCAEPIVFAQSLGEYGALSGLASGVQAVVYSLTAWLGSLSPATLVGAAIVGLALVFVWNRI